MIYANILIEDLKNLNSASLKLIGNLEQVNKYLIDKSDIHNLEKSMKALENANGEYQLALLEVDNLVKSTHCKKLSTLVEMSNNDILIDTYNETIELTKKVHEENKNVRSLLELCQKLTNNHINLLFGKTQQPTNYNIDKSNLNKHMLNHFKNTK